MMTNNNNNDNMTALSLTEAVRICALLKSAAYARSTDTDRADICAFRLERAGGDAVLVATDGHRMHVARAAGRLLPRDWSVVLPSTAHVRKLMASPTAMLAALDGAVDTWMDACDREYPDWKCVVPVHHVWRVRVEATRLLGAIKYAELVIAASLAERKAAHAVTLAALRATEREAAAACKDWRDSHPNWRLSAAYDKLLNARRKAEQAASACWGSQPTAGGGVRVTAGDSAPEVWIDTLLAGADATGKAEVLEATGDCDFGMNLRYLREAVAAVGGPVVTLEGCNALSPVKIYTDEADGYAVVMPMRV